MPYRSLSIEPEHFYHLYNRGNNREPIFFEPENYSFFLQRFVKYFPTDKAEIHAYCLLPNHFHLLVQLLSELDYSSRMQHFGISFSKSINTRYGRVGHLFQGRFKVKHVDSTEYLLHLSRYIHLNPCFARLVEKAEDWEFSSYRDYVPKRKIPEITESKRREISGIVQDEMPEVTQAKQTETSRIYQRPPLTTDFILSHFDGVEEYREFIESFADEQIKQMEDQLWK
jgi:REP element-mobilizing transposase RayT